MSSDRRERGGRGFEVGNSRESPRHRKLLRSGWKRNWRVSWTTTVESLPRFSLVLRRSVGLILMGLEIYKVAVFRLRVLLKPAVVSRLAASRWSLLSRRSSTWLSSRSNYKASCIRFHSSTPLISPRTVNTRGSLLPDPEHDEIFALFYCLQSENDGLVKNGRDPEANRHVGVIAVGSSSLKKQVGNMGIAFDVVPDELALIKLFVRKVRDEWDPECFAGYEVHHSSWGYLLERTYTRYATGTQRLAVFSSS